MINPSSSQTLEAVDASLFSLYSEGPFLQHIATSPEKMLKENLNYTSPALQLDCCYVQSIFIDALMDGFLLPKPFDTL
jgi:hypothetical protein